jgi:hypothetical protein
MRFPYKAYDQMVAAERAAEIPAITPEKKEETKKEESVFDDPEQPVVKESEPEPEADPEPEGGNNDGN